MTGFVTGPIVTGPGDVDLTAVEFWHGDPYPAFAWLREHAPVFRHRSTPVTGGREFWAVTRYEDVVRVSRAPDIFCSGQGIEITRWGPEMDEFADSLVNMSHLDDPEHRWMRALVSRGFQLRAVEALEADCRALVTAILDRAAGSDTCDFAADVAAELPAQIIGEMIGIPPADRSLLQEWTTVVAQDVRRTPQPATGGAATGGDLVERAGGADGVDEVVGFSPVGVRALSEMFDYLASLEKERAGGPGTDLVSALLHAEVDGRRLTRAERRGFFVLFWFAGRQTVRNAISGGLQALLEHPEQRDRLIADPGLVDTATDEIVRWTTPSTHFRRTATRDVELGGQQVRAGDWVVVYYASANRDERTFPDPERFDVGRTPNPHLGFGGGGPHWCLGAPLARLQIRVLFEELLRRFPDVRIVGPVERVPSALQPGIMSLPVRLGAQRPAVLTARRSPAGSAAAGEPA
ncbi:cytochrome P450 [Frankia sp. Cpl3]|nr:cytochrome P450 [Frankia sp. Cpl3]